MVTLQLQKGMDRRGVALGNRLHFGDLKAGGKTLQGKIPRWIWHSALYAVCVFSPVGVEQTVAVRQVEAAVKRPHAASLQSFQIPSHGALLNAFVYVAAGAGPHPVVILLHGFPGNERNLDLAQEIRRAGWDVLYFDYRGSWGSPGGFSFSHGIEDTMAAIDFLRTPAMATTLNLDPERIVVIGHSMGGFMAVQAAATDSRILGVALISASDIGGHVVPQPLSKDREPAVVQGLSTLYESWGMAPLAGCTPEGLAYETIDNASQWSFTARVSALEGRPALIITSDDGNVSAGLLFASALRRAGNTRVSTLHLPTDHAYSDQRGPLAGAVLRWLATITPAGA